MNYLLINTSNNELVIVLNKNGKIFACNEKDVKRHNEVLLAKLEEVLKMANVQLKDIDEFGIVIGPGSFTGIRVGVATVKAFKNVFNKPVRAINNLDLLYQISLNQYPEIKTVAIEGSLNSYFVATVNDGKLNIYERNLTLEELKTVCKGEKVAFYNNSHNFELGVEIDFDNDAFMKSFLNSKNYDLTPIYYQLSQAENDKISHSNILIREAEVWDIKAIMDLCQNSFKDYPLNELQQQLSEKGNIVYVAQIDAQIVGCIIISKHSRDIFIKFVLVDVNFRNHSIGTKLINYVESIASKQKLQVIIPVFEQNFMLKTLCEKLGYNANEVSKDVIIKYDEKLINNAKYIMLK